METRQMKIGIWFYALGTILTGLLNIAFRAFDGSHQPIQALGNNLPGLSVLACVVGVCLVAAGAAILWPRTAKIGAAASAILYLAFAALWLFRYVAAVHQYGWKIAVFFGVSFGVAQQIMLVSPAAILFASAFPTDSPLQKRSATAARWMLGVPPILFGLFHLAAIHVFATIVPQWIPFGSFWAVLTGIAFVLSGVAICSGIKDVLAARLLALMLLLFEGLVEAPPILDRLHSQATWGAAVYNLTAIGACWIFAQLIATRASRPQIELAPNAPPSRRDRVVA